MECNGHDAGSPGPNILLITCHDLGRHLGCYDRGVETPSIDRLAEDGVTLGNHFCAAPQCCPSRGSLLTGRYPHNHGLMGQITWGWELPSSETTLPERLAAEGYSTNLFGIQHVRHDSTSLYKEVHTENGRARHVGERFADDLPELIQGGPFFASLGFHEPHLTQGDDPPWTFRFPDVPDEAYEYYSAENVDSFPYLPERRGIKEMIATLNGLITATVDQAVDDILRSLDEAGIAEDTLVIFTTDHGLPFPRAKGTCYDPGLETAFVARLPGVFEGGQRFGELTSHVDVLPTLLDFLSVEIPQNVDGRSFLPLLTDGSYTPRDHIYAEMSWHERYVPMRALRTPRYKYVRNFFKQQRVHLPADIFGSKAGREVRESYYITERPFEELYDLKNDPNEQRNLASNRGVFDPVDEAGTADPNSRPNPEHAEILTELRNRVETWMRETDDPLLDGPVLRPGTGAWSDPSGK